METVKEQELGKGVKGAIEVLLMNAVSESVFQTVYEIEAIIKGDKRHPFFRVINPHILAEILDTLISRGKIKYTTHETGNKNRTEISLHLANEWTKIQGKKTKGYRKKIG